MCILHKDSKDERLLCNHQPENIRGNVPAWHTGTMCTYAVGVYLISADSLLRCCSAQFGACRWKATCTQRRRWRFERKCVGRRVYMSETTFHEWVKIKDGRGCSEEVVAKGKGHARKTGRRRRGRAHRQPIREQSARPSPSSVQWSGTALPPMGVNWVWQGTVRTRNTSMGLKTGSRFMILWSFNHICDIYLEATYTTNKNLMRGCKK